MEGAGLFIVMKLLLINKHMGNNNMTMKYSIHCSSEKILNETVSLLKQMKKRDLCIPDELWEASFKSPIKNLWKLVRQLHDDMILLKVCIKDKSPKPEAEEAILDMVYNHTTIYRGGEFMDY